MSEFDFFLFANVNFVPGEYGTWQAAYDKLGDYVWNDEPTTKSYYFGIPFDYAQNVPDTTLMFAFEVYENRAGLYETHLKSPAMSTFLQTALPVMTTGLDLAHYSKGGGFLDLPGDKRECAIMHDTRIRCASKEARAVVVGKLSEIADKIATQSTVDQEGCYTFLVCESLDDEVEARVYTRFRTRDDLEKHIRRPDVAAFWKEHGQKEVVTMGQRGFVPNGKGWLHR